MEPFPSAQTAARWLAAELAPKLLRAEQCRPVPRMFATPPERLEWL